MTYVVTTTTHQNPSKSEHQRSNVLSANDELMICLDSFRSILSQNLLVPYLHQLILGFLQGLLLS